MRRERENAPIVYAAHGNSSCKRAPACASARARVPVTRRTGSVTLFLWGRVEAAREPLIAPQNRHQRPQTLVNNPTHPPLEKKFAQEQRRRRKRARRGLAHQIRTCASSPTARARSAQAAGRWRAHMPRQLRHCKYHIQNGCGVSVACARGPFLRKDACSPQRLRSRLRPFSAARCSCAPAPDPRPSLPSPLPPAVSARDAAVFFLRLLFSARLGHRFVALVVVLRGSVARSAVCLRALLRAARPNRTTARRGR